MPNKKDTFTVTSPADSLRSLKEFNERVVRLTQAASLSLDFGLEKTRLELQAVFIQAN